MLSFLLVFGCFSFWLLICVWFGLWGLGLLCVLAPDRLLGIWFGFVALELVGLVLRTLVVWA